MSDDKRDKVWDEVSDSRPLILDIGGEGRHPQAWNVNPSQWRTYGPSRGEPIPRWICGRADAIPLPDRVADVILVERTPLTRAACHELRRVVRPGGTIVLRHVRPFGWDPHVVAKDVLLGDTRQGDCEVGGKHCQELVITSPDCEDTASQLPGRSG
jgi:hypothetical protein